MVLLPRNAIPAAFVFPDGRIPGVPRRRPAFPAWLLWPGGLLAGLLLVVIGFGAYLHADSSGRAPILPGPRRYPPAYHHRAAHRAELPGIQVFGELAGRQDEGVA